MQALRLHTQTEASPDSISAITEQYLRSWTARDTNTFRAKQKDLAYFVAFVGGDNTIEAVNKAVVDEWKKQMLRGGSAPATVNRRLATVKHCFSVMTDHNPTRHVKSLRLAREPVPVLTEHEVEICIKVARTAGENEFVKLRSEALVRTLMATGMRISEVLNLHGFQYQPDMCRFHAVSQKGDLVRSVYFPSSLKLDLYRYVEERRQILDRHNGKRLRETDLQRYPLFVSTHQAQKEHPATYRLGYEAAQNLFERISEEAGRRITAHTLRHDFAKRLLAHTGSVVLVQAALGHATITTTQRYVATPAVEVREALQSMESHDRRNGAVGSNSKASDPGCVCRPNVDRCTPEAR